MIAQRFKQIEDIYQSLNIYRSLIVYDDVDEFLRLKEILLQNDYPISTDGNCRMYNILNTKLDLHSEDIQWDTINVVICFDDQSFEYIKANVDELTNVIILIKI